MTKEIQMRMARWKFFGGTKRNKTEQLEWPKVFEVTIEIFEMAEGFGALDIEMLKWRGILRVIKRKARKDREGEAESES